MKKQLIMGLVSLIGLSISVLQGQNLVQNPSFENYSDCPTTIGQLDFVENWYSLNDGSPDYFNTCTISPVIDVPNNQYGTQTPSSGDGYTGFVAFGEDEEREYVSVPLSQTLVVGETYCVDFKVSLGEESVYGIQDIGALFTTTMEQVNNGGTVVEAEPQILYTEDIIVESNNWLTVSGILTADQPYEFIHIGNFFSNENTTGGGTFPGAPDIIDAYYYLDDVSVQNLIPDLLTIPDTQQVCQGDFINIIASGGNEDTYSWSPMNNPGLILSNTPTLSQAVFQSTTFIVSASVGSCMVSDTVFIETVPVPNVDFTAQNTCVDQGTVFIDLSTDILPNATYEWDVDNDGSIESTTAGEATIVFEEAGNYTVSLTIYNNQFCFAELQQTFFITEDCDPCDSPFNYAPNPSFESFDNCPEELGLEGTITDWIQPTQGTSDFFHPCATDTEDPLDFPGVPINTFGTQEALNGNAYTGFFAYRTSPEYREYISAQLVEPLMAGQTYCVNFNVSLGDNVGFAVEEIGAYFSAGAINEMTQGPLGFTPQIENTNGVILETDDWVTISGTFTPEENLDWITIGNFYGNDSTTIASVGSGNEDLDEIAYYYLDAVSISTIPVTDFDPIGYGICEGETFEIEAPEGFCDYAWYLVDEPDNVLSTTSSLSYTPTTLGPIEIAFVGGKNDCSITETFFLNNNTAPVANFAFESGCVEDVVAFVNISENTTDETVFQWDFNGDGNTDQVSGGSIGHFYSQPGSYQVTLTVVNPGGCSAEITKTVNVSAECDPCAPANLLFNPGFEFFDSCPTELGDITQAFDWFSPTDTPADFFHSCGVDGLTDIPNNFYGSLDAFAGSGYAGLVAFVEDSDYREYISTQLPTPLVVGQQYCIGFKVHISPGSGFAVDLLGAYFTENAFIPVDNAVPQAVNESSDIIFQPGWVEVSAVFTADQPYEYLTLGNFFGIDFPDLNALDIPNGPNNDTAYYYIDNISLVPTDLEVTATDESICQGDQVTLTANTSLCNHRWSVLGDSTFISFLPSINVAPLETTTYVYTGSNQACEAISQQITIEVFSSPDLGNDLFLCPDLTGLTLAEFNGNIASYSWTPTEDLIGPNTANPVASPEVNTTYILNATYDEPTPCPTSDTLVVFVIPSFAQLNTPSADSVCLGQPYQLSVSGGINYQWFANDLEVFSDPNIANPTLILNESETVYVEIGNAEGTCIETEFFNLTVVDCDLGGPSWIDDNNNVINELCTDVVRNDTLVLPLPQITDPDLPNDNLSVSFIEPSNGVANVDPDELVYVPNQNYSGTDTLYIVACDEAFPVQCDTLLICITVVNDAPQFGEQELCIGVNPSENITHCFDILDDFSDYEELTFTILENTTIDGTVSIDDDNCLSYESTDDVGFGDEFEVIGCDPDGACDTVSIQILNVPENGAPMVSNSSVAALQGIPINFCLNVDDPNLNTTWGEVLSTQIFTMPSNGTIEAIDDTCFIYTPDIDFIGNDFINFQICDDGLDVLEDLAGLCDSIVSYTSTSEALCENVQITVIVADGLVANDDMSNAEDNEPSIFNVLDNDIPSTGVELNIVQFPSNGQVAINADNSFTYMASNGYLGPDSLVYSICLDPLGCDTATWYINVVNDIAANDDAINAIEDQPLSIPVLSNDWYPAFEQLVVTIVQQPPNGFVSVNIDQTVSYFPDEDYNGTDSFIYEICNPGVGCDQAVVTVNIMAALPPNLQNDFGVTDIGVPAIIDFLANDSDPLGDTLIVKSFETSSNGSVEFDSLTLMLEYEPNDGFFGSDTIAYTVCNSNGLLSTAFIIFSVTAPNCDLEQAIPGGISPSILDGKNDFFEIQELLSCPEYLDNEVTIFNRWGSKVYSKISYGVDGEWWNGTWENNEEALPKGTYFYLIETFYQGETEIFKGSVEVF